MNGRFFAVLTLSGTTLASVAWAQSSPDIEIGTTRIGGPGTQRQQAVQASVEAEEYLTEDNLPPKESKKRIPSLHTLGARYVGSKQWIDACEKYDSIVDEGGSEALESDPRGKPNAFVAYLQCAKIAQGGGDFDKAERLLKRSETYGPSDHRHAGIREKMLREGYRKKLSNGDVNGALELYRQAQAKEMNEDERIWMGDELAKRAWTAYNNKDKRGVEDLMAKTEEIAPLNTEHRRLKEKLEFEGSVGSQLGMLAGGILALVAAWTLLSRWRERAKVAKAAGSAFEDL
jgi:hypothetical protein